MRHAAIILAVVACWGCRSGGTQPPGTTGTPGPTAVFVDHVWARSDSTGLPGVMHIFLSDGTLVMDSCWETYQLATWRAESDSTVVWQEGSAEIRATILELDRAKLVLRLALASGTLDEHYQAASAPYICPDMRR